MGKGSARWTCAAALDLTVNDERYSSFILRVTTAIISEHVTAVIYREFNKDQGASQTESNIISGTEPVTGCIRQGETAGG